LEKKMVLVKVHNPIGKAYESEQKEIKVVKRLDTLSGKIIGFIDDMKPNAGSFLKYIEEFLKNDYRTPATYRVRKYLTPNMAIAQELDSSVQGVVIAWGD